MNSKQKSTKTMLVRVNTFLINNATIVSSLPNYSKYYDIFTSGIDKIEVLSREQVFDKSGYIAAKNRYRKALIPLTFDACRKLHSYAIFTNNDVLIEEIDLTESSFKYASDEKLVKLSEGIHERIQTHSGELETYEITADTISTLGSAIADFKESIPKASLENSNRKENTLILNATLKSTEAALEKIDASLEVIRIKEPKIYNDYKWLRRKDSLNRNYVAVKGQITNAPTKEPVKYANVVFELRKNGSIIPSGTNGSIVKKSAQKGGFLIKSISDGVYDVTISKNGYTEQKTTVAVTNREMAKLEVELVKSEG